MPYTDHKVPLPTEDPDLGSVADALPEATINLLILLERWCRLKRPEGEERRRHRRTSTSSLCTGYVDFIPRRSLNSHFC